MVFDLVAHQRLRACRHRLLDQGHGEIRDADMPAPGRACLTLRQRAQRLRQRHLRIGPVQQQQIDLGQAAAWSGSPWRSVRDRSARNGVVQTLVVTNTSSRRTPRGAQALADLALVLVDLRGVDMAIAEPAAPARRGARRCARAVPRCPARSRGFWRRWPRRIAWLVLRRSEPIMSRGPRCQHAACDDRRRGAVRSSAKRGENVSGAWAITASSARAGPRGMRLPCSQLRMVSTGTPSRAANRAGSGARGGAGRAPPAALAQVGSGRGTTASPARAETPARPAVRRSVRPLSAASAAWSIPPNAAMSAMRVKV